MTHPFDQHDPEEVSKPTRGLNLNEPIWFNNELHLCEECARLAHEFLDAARRAVIDAYVVDAPLIKRHVDVALAAFLKRRDHCTDCNEELPPRGPQLLFENDNRSE